MNGEFTPCSPQYATDSPLAVRTMLPFSKTESTKVNNPDVGPTLRKHCSFLPSPSMSNFAVSIMGLNSVFSQ